MHVISAHETDESKDPAKGKKKSSSQMKSGCSGLQLHQTRRKIEEKHISSKE